MGPRLSIRISPSGTLSTKVPWGSHHGFNCHCDPRVRSISTSTGDCSLYVFKGFSKISSAHLGCQRITSSKQSIRSTERIYSTRLLLLLASLNYMSAERTFTAEVRVGTGPCVADEWHIRFYHHALPASTKAIFGHNLLQNPCDLRRTICLFEGERTIRKTVPSRNPVRVAW